MKKQNTITTYYARLRQHPIAYNVVLIVLTILAIALVAYIAMALGTRHGMRRTVPDFTGLRIDDAEYYASRRGLHIVVNDSLYVPAYPGGMVLDQLPEGGVDVKSGRKIYVTINSFKQKQVPVPYVAERSLRQAKNMLDAAGLTIAELVYVEDIATNYVLAEFCGTTQITPDTRIKVEAGSGITLRVGLAGGEGVTGVPRLIGRTLADARSKIWESGLNVGSVEYDEGITLFNRNDARVYSQSVPMGWRTAYGSKISLVLTLDKEKVAQSEAESDRRARVALEEQAAADSLANTSASEQRTAEQEGTKVPTADNAEDEFFQ